jgi:NAD(P)-dependent dehydrogenase (short-subunit alcohol dehydrogenase family)
VNAVSPGPIDTPAIDVLVGAGATDGFKSAMAAACRSAAWEPPTRSPAR